MTGSRDSGPNDRVERFRSKRPEADVAVDWRSPIPGGQKVSVIVEDRRWSA